MADQKQEGSPAMTPTGLTSYDPCFHITMLYKQFNMSLIGSWFTIIMTIPEP